MKAAGARRPLPLREHGPIRHVLAADKRRAFHDYIAGTVVVRSAETPATTPGVIILDQPIVPGRSAAAITIGDSFSETAGWLGAAREVEALPGGSRHVFGPLKLWEEDGLITQIGVGEGYRGKVHGVVGIGSTLAEVQAAFGEVVENEDDNLVVPSMPGWAFETTEWLDGHALDPQATISEIYVFAPTA